MSKDSKISFFLPSLRGGGAEKSLLNLAKGFAAKGFMVDLVLAKKTGVYLSDVPKDVNIIDLHSNRLTLALFPLIQYLKKENPKALISAMPHVNLVSLTAQKFSGFPGKIVVTEQNFFSIDQRSVGLIKRNITRFLVKKLYPKAAAVVPISSGVALDLSRISRIAEKDLHIIHNPMDIKDIEKKSHSDISHKWFSNNHIKVILGVGRLTDQKDFSTLINAFNFIKKDNVRLIILGEGEERGKLEKLIKDLGLKDYVDMPGFVDNPYAYMSKADVFVLSSKYEGFGNVIVEAMACGTSVVSTSCPSGPAEVLKDGKYGILVSVGDYEALGVAALEACMDQSNPSKLKKRAQDFSISKITNQYLEILN